jgi:hypothetical protein
MCDRDEDPGHSFRPLSHGNLDDWIGDEPSAGAEPEAAS